MLSVHSILKSKTNKKSMIKGRSKLQKNNSIFNLKPVNTNKTYFSGSGKDMIFGILYLIKKYNTVCDVTQRNSKISYSDFMYEITIMYVCNNKKNATPEDYQILFPFGKTNFDNNLNKCKKRFIVVPLFFENYKKCKNDTAHYNILIIDRKNKTMERFESYGYGLKKNNLNKYYVFKSFDSKIDKLYPSYTYISPEKFCPLDGLQEIEEEEIYNNSDIETYSDPGGFCGVWGIWYAELRLKYPNMDRKKLLNKASKIIMKQKNLRSYIRNYSGKLNRHKSRILKTLKKKRDKLKNLSKLKLLDNIIYE